MEGLALSQKFAIAFDDPRLWIPLAAVGLFLIAMVLMIYRDED